MCSSSHSDFHSFFLHVMYRWLSVKTSLRETALDFGIGETTLSNSITEVCEALVASCGGLIYLPRTAKEWQVVAGEFAVLFSMPNTVGAIDGSHIPIVRPAPELQRSYYNRHHTHSMVLQGLVRADGRFMDVNVGWQGCQGDARIYELSDLGKRINSDPPLLPPHYWILGDKAYPLSKNLLTPHRAVRPFTEGEKMFNTKHSQTRVVVETGFGALKNRFRRLNTDNTLDLRKVPLLTYATCILHNICIMKHDPYPLEELEDYVERERKWAEKILDVDLLDEYGDVGSGLAAQERLATTAGHDIAARGLAINFEKSTPSDLRKKVGEWIQRNTMYG